MATRVETAGDPGQHERLGALLDVVRARNPLQRARMAHLPAEAALADLPFLTATFRAGGVGPGDRVALAFSFGPHVRVWAAKEGAQEAGATAVPLGGMTSVQRLRTIAEVGATVLCCTPTYALRLAEVAVEEGLEAALETVSAVFCTGEPGASLPAVRARIEAALGACCLDHAGATEAGPFGLPCAEGGGLHSESGGKDEISLEVELADGAAARRVIDLRAVRSR